MLIQKRKDESVQEWIEQVRSMAPLPGYPETPEWWIELFPMEWGEEDEQRQDRGA